MAEEGNKAKQLCRCGRAIEPGKDQCIVCMSLCRACHKNRSGDSGYCPGCREKALAELEAETPPLRAKEFPWQVFDARQENCQHLTSKKFGHNRNGEQRYRCLECGATFSRQENRYRKPRERRDKVEAKTEAKELILAGQSIREVQIGSGLAKETVSRIRKEVAEQIPACDCGRPAGHKGWCPKRFQESPARQKVMKAMHKRAGYKVFPSILEGLQPIPDNPPELLELAELALKAVVAADLNDEDWEKHQNNLWGSADSLVLRIMAHRESKKIVDEAMIQWAIQDIGAVLRMDTPPLENLWEMIHAAMMQVMVSERETAQKAVKKVREANTSKKTAG